MNDVKYDFTLTSPFCKPGVGDQQANRLWDEVNSLLRDKEVLLSKIAAYEVIFDEVYDTLKYSGEDNLLTVYYRLVKMLDEFRSFREKSIVQP